MTICTGGSARTPKPPVPCQNLVRLDSTGLTEHLDSDILSPLICPQAQMERIKAWCAAGKPVVALRPSIVAFNSWPTFNQEIFGARYGGHTGFLANLRFEVNAAAKDHPILKGVGSWTCTSKNMLYRYPDLRKQATVLLTVTHNQKSYPIAWTYTYDREKGGRAFYSLLGIPCDFEEARFRTLLINALFWTVNRAVPEVAERAEE